MTPWTCATLQPLESFCSILSHLLSTILAVFGKDRTSIFVYSIIGVGSVFCFVFYMVYSIFKRSTGRQSGESSSQQHLNGGLEEEGQRDGIEHSCERRSARRQGIPRPLDLSGSMPVRVSSDRLSRSSTGQSVRLMQHPHTSTHPALPLGSPTILGITSLTFSPTVERNFPQLETNIAPRALTFPREILVMIFQNVYLQHENQPRHSIAPILSLRSVCKEWKIVIEGTPKLWPSLSPPLRATTGCEPCVGWYIDVTKKLSTMVSGIGVVLRMPEQEEEIQRDLFKHLLKLALSAFVMSITIPDHFLRGTNDATLSPVLFGTPTRRRPSDGPAMENLKRVEWKMSRHWFANQFPQVLQLPWTSLRRLPWAQLTHITLEMLIRLEDCEYILDHASLVEDLDLSNVEGDPLPASNSQLLGRKSCPHLQSLRIVASMSVSPLLQRYDIPNLRILNLELGGIDSAADLHRAAIPWSELIRLSLKCTLQIEVLVSIMVGLARVEDLRLEGDFVSEGTTSWSMSRALDSLKSFTLIPITHVVGLDLMSHFVQHFIPTTITYVNAPLDSTTLNQILDRPITSLTNVDFRNSALLPDEFLSFLTHCHDLETGSFQVHDSVHSSTPSSPPTVFQALPSPIAASFSMPHMHIPTTCNIKSLDLRLQYKSAKARTLLDALTLPKLRSLTINASQKAQECEGLHELLVRSGCALSALHVSCSKVSDKGVLALLELMSASLQSVEIKGGFGKNLLTKTLWARLTHQAIDSRFQESCFCPCPRLERLVVCSCTDVEAFYQMLESRSRFPNGCVCGLQKLRHVEAVVGDNNLGRLSAVESQLRAKNLTVKFDQSLVSVFL